MPAFAATETLKRLQQEYPAYSYREAALNPTNPRDRANSWEREIIRYFTANPAEAELIRERSTPTGPSLSIARPIRITNPACLACHSTPQAAPDSMLRLYGNANGFGWRLNEVVGAQIMSVPMSLPLNNADRATRIFVVGLGAVFFVLFVALNVMLSRSIVSPITQMASAADQISKGDLNLPEFADQGSDEVAALKQSFNRMRRSLTQAMKMLDGQKV